MPRIFILDEDITNRVIRMPTMQRSAQLGSGNANFEFLGWPNLDCITQMHIDLMDGTRILTAYIEGFSFTLDGDLVRIVPQIADPGFHLNHIPVKYGRYKGTFLDLLSQFIDLADAGAVAPVEFFCNQVSYPDEVFGTVMLNVQDRPMEIFANGTDYLETLLTTMCGIVGADFFIDSASERLVIYHRNYSGGNPIVMNLDQIRLTGCVDGKLKGIHDISRSEKMPTINSILCLGRNGDEAQAIEGALDENDLQTDRTEDLKFAVTPPEIRKDLSNLIDGILMAKLIYTVSDPLGSYDFHHYSYTTLIGNITYTLGYNTGPTGTVRRYPPFVGILYRFTALLDRPIGFFRGAMTAPPFTKTEDNWNTIQTMTPTPSNDSQIYNNSVNENVIGSVNFTSIREDQTGLKLVIFYWFNRDGNKNVGGLINPANFLNVGEMQIKLSLAGVVIRQWNFTSSDATPLDRFTNTQAEIFDLAELGLNHLVGSQQLKLEFIGDMNFGFQFTRFFRGSETGPVPVPIFDYYTVVGCTYHLSAFLSGEQSRIDAILADPINQAGTGQFPYGYLGPSVFDNFGVIAGPQLFDSEP